MQKAGTLIKCVGGLCTVLRDGGGYVTCPPRGRFRNVNMKPLAGDRVVLTADEPWAIEEILPRRNELVRPPLANLDCLLLVLSEAPPRSDPMLADALAAACEYRSINVVVVINKCDLHGGGVWRERYAASGYPVHTVSAETGAGIDGLRGALAHKTVALAGMSGVGKSSLLNVLFPSLALQTGEISARMKLGKHTTRHVELLPVGDGCLIADTPGFTTFDADCVKALPRNELARCYPEMRPYMDKCKYRSCQHERDEGCAVVQAVQDGYIHADRHGTFVALGK